jgi:putative transposase
VRNNYQRKERKSNHKFEVARGQELLVRVPLPMAEVWAEMQAQVEELTGRAGLQILRAILENEVTSRVGPPHRPNPSAGCVRWRKQSGYVVFAGQKIPLERPRVRTREGPEVELESYGQLQQDGKLQRAVRERMVAGLSTRNYRRAVESVVEGYGIEKSSVSRQFVEASDRGGLAEWEQTERKKKAKVCLDINRPSHGLEHDTWETLLPQIVSKH